MTNILRADALIRGCWCTLEVTDHLVDGHGPFTLVEVTLNATGEPLFAEDIAADGHLDQAGLLELGSELARGHTEPTDGCGWEWAA